MILKNCDELTSKGNVPGRKIVLDIIEHAIKEVNSYNLVKDLLEVREDLRFGQLSYDLGKINNIFVIGGGKQVTYVAAALEDVLGERINDGIVVEKKGWGCKTNRIRVIEGGHPIPDTDSAKGAEEIIQVARKAKQNDLVIFCVTGGCTSLTMLPPENISLEDIIEVTERLLRSGAPIEEVNTVRKHLSQLGGGKLSMLIHPAEIINLIAIDEVAGIPWGPTVPDTTSFADAINVLSRRHIWNKTPDSVKRYFRRANPSEETPNDYDFKQCGIKLSNLIFAENMMLCKAAEERSKKHVENSSIISTRIEGEAREVATVLVSIAREIERNSMPLMPPCVIVAGGETTVTISNEPGQGGRNQELALTAALKLAGSKRIVLASIGTDGTDGPTDIAGAIVDGFTVDAAKKTALDLNESLEKHNSSIIFRKLQDAIYTHDTGTNLMDLIVIYIGI